ncbi:MAG TPA: serine/threonine-protein kinase [Dokdonella sp.]|uniref:serine/threonine-protein kinase n=1 Tax=Dokdonella sp. TaxID=2291710 RepID=UPI002CF73340|nr:serine/threonine-protein kinase [Dokdonella sp.]HUD43768.1 serine/threonine-protein kinase [Dokdonella sp.]
MELPERRRRLHERELTRQLFDCAADAREPLLAEIAAADATLAERLRWVLREAEALAEEEAERAAAATRPAAGALAGSVIGERFRLLHLLGLGGMGEVYLAERTDDIRRRVALKMVRGDLGVPAERTRRECHILARLDHPNIAGLVDAGFARAGRSWFAMDYVDGEPITAWCDHRGLDVRARVRLFVQVCNAVQFAHRNLVLHRDIKPSNILVDREGTPKLLDFGIAKLLDVTEPQQTQTLALALTPAYAAPERMRGEAATTVSDVYQLGLVLYELLAGVAAFRARRADAVLPRMERALAALAAEDPAAQLRVARARSSGPERLRRQLRGDLERIVAKAAAADPRERYATAQSFAEDLERWDRGLPVAAQRGSFLYRARKLVVRHAAAAALIAALGAGVLASSVLAVQRAQNEREQREVAERQRQVAEDQRRRAEVLLGFMNDVFRQADPQNAGTAASAQMLQRAAAALSARDDLDPPTRALLNTQIADTFNALFMPEAALPVARQAVDALEPLRARRPEDYLTGSRVLFDALQMLDRSAALREGAEHALSFARTVDPGGRWEGVMLKFRGAARCAEEQFGGCAEDLQASIAMLESAGEVAAGDLAEPLNQLALLLSDEGDASAAVRLLERARARLDDRPDARQADRGIIELNLASDLLAQGRFDAAHALLVPLQAKAEMFYAVDGPVILRAVRRRLALRHAVRGETAAAIALMDDAGIADARALSLDQRHALLAELLSARLALDQGRTDAALDRVRRAEAIVDAHPYGLRLLVPRVAAMRGEVLLADRRSGAAAAAFAHGLQELRALIGSTPSWVAAEMLDGLGRCALADGDPMLALDRFAEAAAGFAAATGPQSPSTLRSQLHRLWAQALIAPQPDWAEQFAARRDALAQALGTDAAPAVRRADRLAAAMRAPEGVDAAAFVALPGFH